MVARLSQGAAGELSISHDLDLVRQAHVIYTDCWPKRENDADRERVSGLFSPYRITRCVLDSCPASAIFLPCPPVTRGEEVDDQAMGHPLCRVYEAKEFLLHSQNAILRHVLEID